MSDDKRKYQSTLELLAADANAGNSDYERQELLLETLSGTDREYDIYYSFYEQCRSLKSQHENQLLSEPTDYLGGSIGIGIVAGVLGGAGVNEMFHNVGYGLIAGTVVGLSSLVVGIYLHRTERKEAREARANAAAYDKSVKRLQANYLKQLLGSNKAS